jgi:arginase
MRPLTARKIWLIDGRDLDAGEAELVAGSGVHHVADAADLLTADLPTGPLWVHFDVDVLDPSHVPAVAYPAADGVSADVLGQIFRRLAETGQVAAVSVSSWNPALDGDGSSRRVCMDLVDVLRGA